MKRDLTKYIRELLYRHDCVIIPGFGGFIGNYTPALLDSNSGTFNPPVKQISFNRNLNHNDGLLIGKISESLNVNYGDARNIVSDFVVDFKRKLTTGGTVTFEGIGSFALNSEGSPLFEPDRSTNYLLSSYGLYSYHISPADHFRSGGKPLSRKVRSASTSASLRRVMWRAAVVIPFVATLVIVPLKYDLFKGRVEQVSMNPLLTAQIEDNRVNIDSGKSVPGAFIAEESPVIEVVETSAVEKADMIVETSIEEAGVANTTAIYKVIAGSFKSEDNAVGLVEMLTSQGYYPETKRLDNGFYRVAMVEFSDYNKALQFIRNNKEQYPGIWVSKGI